MKQNKREAVLAQIDMLSRVIGILTGTIIEHIPGSQPLVEDARSTVIICLEAILAEVTE